MAGISPLRASALLSSGLLNLKIVKKAAQCLAPGSAARRGARVSILGGTGNVKEERILPWCELIGSKLEKSGLDLLCIEVILMPN